MALDQRGPSSIHRAKRQGPVPSMSLCRQTTSSAAKWMQYRAPGQASAAGPVGCNVGFGQRLLPSRRYMLLKPVNEAHELLQESLRHFTRVLQRDEQVPVEILGVGRPSQHGEVPLVERLRKNGLAAPLAVAQLEGAPDAAFLRPDILERVLPLARKQWLVDHVLAGVELEGDCLVL